MDSLSNSDLLRQIWDREVAIALAMRFGSLTEMAKASVEELRAIGGVGPKRALSIKSAFQLAVRMSQERYEEGPLLDTPERVADTLREANRLYEVERFQLILLNTRRRLIRVEKVGEGTVDSVLVDPKTVFKPAILAMASAVVLLHNHPSGDPSPSEADIRMTRDLIRAGQLLKIDVVDHIILGKRTEMRVRDFVSLRELGYFFS